MSVPEILAAIKSLEATIDDYFTVTNNGLQQIQNCMDTYSSYLQPPSQFSNPHPNSQIPAPLPPPSVKEDDESRFDFRTTATIVPPSSIPQLTPKSEPYLLPKSSPPIHITDPHETSLLTEPQGSLPSQTSKFQFHPLPQPISENPPTLPILPPQSFHLFLPTLNFGRLYPILQLKQVAIRDTRERGLCYNCAQKWSNTHRCCNKTSSLFGTNEEDDPGDPDPPDLLGVEVSVGNTSSPQALTDSNTPPSLQLCGFITSSIYGYQIYVVLGGEPPPYTRWIKI